MTGNGRFTEAAMTDSMHQIAEQLSLNASNAELLRLTNNAVFALPGADVVIRVTRSYGLHERVRKVARLGDWFAEINAPTIRLVPGITQPVEYERLLATVWEYVSPNDPTPDTTDLGHVLRAFHALGTPGWSLPAWDPVGDARARLADAENLGAADREYLLDWCERLEPRVAELDARSAGSLVHGDAHAGNLLRRADDRVVLCDFDATCVGPWQVDLVPAAVGEARFGRAGAHRVLAEAYGYDVATDPDWALLREARELKMVAAAVPLLGSAPGVADEFAVRLGSVRDNDPEVRWTPFADLRSRSRA